MQWKILPIYLLLLSVFLIQQVSSQDLPSCAGRCGEGYSRDAICNCDYNCQHYMECCPDFKKACTVELSCKGRCFESFARGRECDCDSDCKKYGKCCPDYEDFCGRVHNPTSPPSSKTAPPSPGASQTIKSTAKRSPKAPNKKKTKKVIESEEITEEHSVSENQESSSSSSSSSSTIRKIKSSKNSAANKELKKKPKVKDNKKERTPKKKPPPEPPVVDEAGSGLDNGDIKLTPTPDIPTTQRNKVTTSPKFTTGKPINPKPSLPPNTDTSKETSSTPNKETTVKSKETLANKETSSKAKEKITSAKETRSAEKTPAKDFVPTTKAPVKSTPKAESTTKSPAPTTTKEPTPTTTKKPAPTTPKKPAPTTTTAKDKTTEKDIIPEITTAVPKITTQETATPTEETTTESKTSTTTQVTSTTSSKNTPKATTLAPKVMTATQKTTTTEETMNKPEETTAVPKDTATSTKVSTPRPRKPTKAPKKPASTKKPNTIPKRKKPKTTPTPPKMTTSTMPKLHPTSSVEAMLQTTTSPNQRPNSEIVEVNPNEDTDAAGKKPHMFPRPPVLTPIFIPGTDILVRGSNQDIAINPMLSDETNLCNGKPVDGLTTLRNGTMVAFRGHYFWMLSPSKPPSPPRKITEVWGIPSPIDTVFTRCNCEGKTFFFKGSQYWRFTNDIKDAGYPKQIVKGFGGLNGRIVAALSIAKYKDRPESVYFFKRGGSVQQYTYKQEPIKKCTGRRPAINYPVYGETTQVRRRRFERAIGPSQTHTIRIHYSPIRVSYQDKGFLHNEVKMSSQWRGFPNVVTSAIALPNIRKPDGYDYYAFSRNQYYNIDVPSRTARVVTTRFGRTLSNIWYNCP
eukprot:XP_005623018.1 proteoglycan 4 [Canis lupus familiaris]